ncbi:MAG: FAD-dependent oxidoreductase [Hydrogenimonas sp.]|nr:FAD-dependent oxidoreductase [Hydrogenimonas sp.]
MKRVVIAGGGYGGLRAVEKLAQNDNLEVVLIDANSYHFMQTEVYGYIAGNRYIDELAVDLSLWCEGFKNGKVRFIQDRIVGLNPKEKELVLSDLKIEYDYLIIATGAKTRFPDSIKGLREYSFGVKRLDRAFGFRHRFEEAIKRKLDGDSKKVDIAVIGAGLSGVEVAAEMGYMLKRYKKMLGGHTGEIKVTLYDACETILPGMNDSIIDASVKRVKNLGIEIVTSAYIKEVSSDKIYFENAKSRDYTFMIFTGGILGNSEFAPKHFEKNFIEQLKVTSTLNIKDHGEIFAIGDVAEILDQHGQQLPPTAQIAEQSAEYCAKAIEADIKGDKIGPFKGKMYGIFIALGGRYAAAEILGFNISGITAYFLKKVITLVYFLGIDLRANTGFKIRSKKMV